jgi:hypothetical protein
MSHAYTEDQLVEQPAVALLAELGWTIAGPHPAHVYEAGAQRSGAMQKVS